jgi:hypothetical protein
MKNNPRALFLLHQTLQLALCIQTGSVSWHLPNGEVWFITRENAFPLLQIPMAASFTPLQPMLGIARGDLRLVCGCSVMETHFMKLPGNSSCADVREWMLQPRTDNVYALRASALCVPFCELVWSAPRRFHFTITALIVDRGNSSRA